MDIFIHLNIHPLLRDMPDSDAEAPPPARVRVAV